MKTQQENANQVERFSCLYPTFKEWKLQYEFDRDYINGVYILPLRNENTKKILFSSSSPAFISYL